ncbi:MAG: LPS export ABC transporter permease LptF [Gammaproteobacteria bacterium]|nr:LPS export ABC transporter permease LptF [Gammaproteobacteria bacterium]
MLIERYLTTEIVKPFLAGLLILVTVFIAFSAAVRLADAASGEIAAAAVTQLIILSTLASMEVLVPTTLYLAILFAIGRWYKDSEMAALAAAGVGEMQLLWSVFKIGVIAAVIVALLSIYVRPWAYGTSYALEQATISRFDLGNIPPGSFVDLGNGGYVLHAREVDKDRDELRGVFVQRDRPGRSQVIAAERARINAMDEEGSRSVEFFDGHAYLLDKSGPHDINMRFASFLIRFPEEERISKFRRKAVDTATLGASDEPKDIAELQWRLSTPLATLLLTLLAVPLSRANPRQSLFAIFAVAVLAYLLLFSASSVVRNWLENGDIPAFPGMLLAYVPSLALLALLLAMPRLRLHGLRR